LSTPPPSSKSTIFAPREYQVNIASIASKRNTLVILPTGLGKTMIAALVAQTRLQSFPNGRVLVMSPTRPLTLQHYTTFKELLNQLPSNSFAILTGLMSPDKRGAVWKSSKLIFATPQTVFNDLKRSASKDNDENSNDLLKDFVLVVFDEAHRCVKDYSYTAVARFYKKQSHDPLILGLTASPGGSRERIQEIISNLFIEKVEARTEEDADVSPYVEKTRLESFKVKLPPEFLSLLKPLKDLYTEKVEKLRSIGLLPKDRLSKKILLDSRNTILARLKKATGINRGYVFASLLSQAQAVMILHAIELLETQGIETLSKYMSRMREKNPENGRAARSLLKDERWIFVENKIKDLALLHQYLKKSQHPKIEKLKDLINEQIQRKEDSKIIVFTQYRDTIDTIVEYLSSSNQTDLKVERFVGQANRLENKGMDQKSQVEVLERFRNKMFNVLVSSSIGEEGLHVPDVDLVVFYEAVPSEIRSIQRRGRTGRTMPGRVAILIAEDTVDEVYYYSSFYKEQRMRKIISSQNSSLDSVIRRQEEEEEAKRSSQDNETRNKEKNIKTKSTRELSPSSLLTYM
jgi:ERCC4-related helicase